MSLIYFKNKIIKTQEKYNIFMEYTKIFQKFYYYFIIIKKKIS